MTYSKQDQLKGMKKTKKVKSNRKKLVKELDSLVSQIVRARDGKCVMCGSTQQLGCGHVFSRKAYSTRWDLNNCHCQCWSHNFAHTKDTVPYFSWFQKKFGMDAFDQLYIKFKTTRKWTTPLLATYKILLQNELEKYVNPLTH